MLLDFIGNVKQMRLLHGVVKFDRSNLNRFKCPIDFLRSSASEEDFSNPMFKLFAVSNFPQRGIAAAQYPIEDFQLVGEQFPQALLRLIISIEEVHNHHVIPLFATVTTTDSLLNALRIPRQVIVYQQ